MRSSYVLPVLAAGAAAATVFAVVAVSSSNGSGLAGSGSSNLRTLRIGTYQELPGASSSSSKSGRYTLRGSLPTAPTNGTVWSLGRIDDGAAKAAALARSFGLRGAVGHDAHGWTVTDGTAKLRVYDAVGSPWGYASTTSWRDCAPIPVDGYSASGVSTGCAVSSSPGAGSVSAADARQLAEPVLGLLGLPTAKVYGDTSMRYVSADPVVDGLATTGFSTNVVVRPAGAVMAGGWLAPIEHAMKAVGTYPLRSAHAAFDGLGSLPVPEVACMVGKPCPWSDPITITGATYGLMAAWDNGREPLLVPAWYLAVSGDGGPVVQGALSSRYLSNPVGDGGTGGAGTGKTGSGGTTPAESPPNPGPGASEGPPYGISPVAPIKVPGPPKSPQASQAR
jgi:hypothetical protein